MAPTLPNTIDDVIAVLDDIIQDAKEQNDPLGYFPVLYRRVTIKVKEGIAAGYFQDGPRMERLDVVFANRYIEAYYAYRQKMPVTNSWNVAFQRCNFYWPVVLQHLLLGINAHINLDLGIAAAEISRERDIEDLEVDFIRINSILAGLVDEVQENLSNIWPGLRRILIRTGQMDNRIVDFSMERARTGAWKFACLLANTSAADWENAIQNRDQKVARKASLVSSPGWMVQLYLWVIRLSERGSVREKIRMLEGGQNG